MNGLARDAVLDTARSTFERRDAAFQLVPVVALIVATLVAGRRHRRSLAALQVRLEQLVSGDRSAFAVLNDLLALVLAHVRTADVNVVRMLDPVLEARQAEVVEAFAKHDPLADVDILHADRASEDVRVRDVRPIVERHKVAELGHRRSFTPLHVLLDVRLVVELGDR